MKKIAIITALTSILALAFSATATAGGNFSNNDYQGHVAKDPGTFMGFDLNGSKSKLSRITAGVKLQCTNGETGKILFRGKSSLKVDGNDRFGGKVKLRKLQNPGGVPLFEGKYKVTGQLQKRGKAKGDVSGSFKFDDEQDGRVTCNSGTVPWKAEKGKKVTPIDQDPERAIR